jgi:hypothetical protein
MLEGITYGTYILFGLLTLIGAAFIWFFVPETKRLSLEEMVCTPILSNTNTNWFRILSLDPRELPRLITREWRRLTERLVSTTSSTVQEPFILTRMFTKMLRRISRLEY